MAVSSPEEWTAINTLVFATSCSRVWTKLQRALSCGAHEWPSSRRNLVDASWVPGWRGAQRLAGLSHPYSAPIP
jgi:hypothetical protein